mmetsp:Transcript_4997/g.16516  ORF Transcript_4997/g.16516 Transcript_4997/m.16516 type:complete len:266 (-) Transcript_4997:2466-3263(-)
MCRRWRPSTTPPFPPSSARPRSWAVAAPSTAAPPAGRPTKASSCMSSRPRPRWHPCTCSHPSRPARPSAPAASTWLSTWLAPARVAWRPSWPTGSSRRSSCSSVRVAPVWLRPRGKRWPTTRWPTTSRSRWTRSIRGRRCTAGFSGCCPGTRPPPMARSSRWPRRRGPPRSCLASPRRSGSSRWCKCPPTVQTACGAPRGCWALAGRRWPSPGLSTVTPSSGLGGPRSWPWLGTPTCPSASWLGRSQPSTRPTFSSSAGCSRRAT